MGTGGASQMAPGSPSPAGVGPVKDLVHGGHAVPPHGGHVPARHDGIVHARVQSKFLGKKGGRGRGTVRPLPPLQAAQPRPAPTCCGGPGGWVPLPRGPNTQRPLPKSCSRSSRRVRPPGGPAPPARPGALTLANRVFPVPGGPCIRMFLYTLLFLLVFLVAMAMSRTRASRLGCQGTRPFGGNCHRGCPSRAPGPARRAADPRLGLSQQMPLQE